VIPKNIQIKENPAVSRLRSKQSKSRIRKLSRLPDSPGVYLMKNSRGKILYIGKAGNLKRRVNSYFNRTNEFRIDRLVKEISRIDYQKTETAIEALIKESQLIKKHQPPYNVIDKDDKSFLYVVITNEKFPRIMLARGKDLSSTRPPKQPSRSTNQHFGPFTSASSLKEALRMIRRIFPWNAHTPKEIDGAKRPCLNWEIGLCPGACAKKLSVTDYKKTVRNIKLFFRGKKGRIHQNLKQEMRQASKALKFEKAEKLKRQIFALKHIQDIALISDTQLTTDNSQPTTNNPQPTTRIEGYDISNISGASAVGSMVVFMGDKPDKNEYRKFKIRTVQGSDDVGMLREVLRRRFKHTPPAGRWPLPHLILIDGGKGQVGAVKKVLKESNLKIPVVGIAKGSKRKKNEFIGAVPPHINPKILIQVRDEAHRFAISYHKKLRGKAFVKKE
jgi:excinuclease ABC subunit C